jgi:hypothetical protein
MKTRSVAGLVLGLAGCLLVQAVRGQEGKPAATLLAPGGAALQLHVFRAAKGAWAALDASERTVALYAGDSVRALAPTRARLLYADGRSARLVPGSARAIVPAGAPEAGGWERVQLALERVVEGFTAAFVGAPLPVMEQVTRHGAGRGDGEAAYDPLLLLPPADRVFPLLERRPTFRWLSGGHPAGTSYALRLYRNVPPDRCGRSGTPVFDLAVADTFLAYPGDVPPLEPGVTYRLELEVPGASGTDLACLVPVGDEERAHVAGLVRRLGGEEGGEAEPVPAEALLEVLLYAGLGYAYDALALADRLAAPPGAPPDVRQVRAYVYERQGLSGKMSQAQH